MMWLSTQERFLLRQWRKLKRREAHLEANNCPYLAREVRAAADRFKVLLDEARAR